MAKEKTVNVILCSFCGKLTEWSRVLTEKLTCPQLVEKFSAFYGIRRSIPAFTKPATRPYPEPDQSNPRLSIPLLKDPF